MRRLSARSHIGLGQTSLVITLLLVAFFVGLVPDRVGALRDGRIALAEAIAINSAGLIVQEDLPRLNATLRLMVERNADLLSVAVRPAGGEAVVTVGDHAWPELTDGLSTDRQIQVPIWSGKERWGQVELRFAPFTASGWLGMVQRPLVLLIAFMALSAFVAFYLYLGKVLKHLDPSQAVPAHVRAALDTLAEGLMIIDLKEDIVLANQAFASILGRPSEELIGQSASKLAWVTPDGAPLSETEFPWSKALPDGSLQRNDALHLHDTDSKRRTFMVNASPVFSSGGKYGGVLISLDDVTQLEAHKVELRESKENAEAANKAKSEFLANMSHEIRTPMNAILGFADVLRRGYDRSEPERQRYLNTIHSSGEHLLLLINDVLDLSKVESGNLEVERIPLAPHVLIREVTTVLGVKAQEKGISLEFDVDGVIPETIQSDPTRLRQIVTNLTGNAIKFTRQGAVKVLLRLTSKAEGRLVAIDVSDDGVGVPQDKLGSIFDPFVQADSSVTRSFGGTGLGLSISRRLARIMGGDIVVRSEVGKGSVFTVTIDPGPLAGVTLLQPQEALAAIQETGGGSEETWQFPPARVLVVDDGEENRDLVKVVLQEVGLEVEGAENGRVAVEKARRGRYALILMDMHMPEMDGYTATKVLRQAGLKSPIIALTADAMKGFEQQCLAAGCTGYLTKPINIDLLLQTLAKPLGGQRVKAQGPPISASAPVSPRSVPVDFPVGSKSPPDFSPDGPPVVSRLAGHSPRMRATLATFARRLEEKLNEMDASWAQRDFKRLAELAHWLKGSGGTVGYDAFTEPAKTLEGLAKAGTADGIDATLRELHGLAGRLVVPDEHERAVVTG